MMHVMRQPGWLRMLLTGEKYYDYVPGPNGQCVCPNCVKEKEKQQ